MCVCVCVCARAPSHGIDIVRPHPTDDDEYDAYIHLYIEKMNDCGSQLRESNTGLPFERRDV